MRLILESFSSSGTSPTRTTDFAADAPLPYARPPRRDGAALVPSTKADALDFATLVQIADAAQHERAAPSDAFRTVPSLKPFVRSGGLASTDASGFTNRLAQEASPYLLQHASNPVEWYPWGEEAFAKSRSEKKPIFLSVGYSTCHWCHVMERESFEDPATAQILNANFVSVKVDREERPDVDRVYMSYVQATSGHGGWPMSVFLTPELKPFFGGTYFPKESNYGMPSFSGLLNTIASAWNEKRDLILQQSEETMQELTRHLLHKQAAAPKTDLDKAVEGFVSGCVDRLARNFDRANGGFSSAPKFPRPAEMHALLAQSFRLKDKDDARAKDLVQMVKWTLHKMSNGGVYDHVGGGFHRYSVDELWHVPHFEKMLYDNPQIALVALHVFQLSREPKWGRIASGILDYLKREMTDPSGGIYSAEDADSFDPLKGEKAEGAFYVWEASELSAVLTPREYELFAAVYNVRANGNCNNSERSDPHREFVGKNCLYVSKDVAAIAEQFEMDPDALQSLLAKCRKKVYDRRKLRPRPHLDNKIVAAWNGMAMSAFAQASRILKSVDSTAVFPIAGHSAETYGEDARRIGEFVLDKLWDAKKEVLKRSHCGGVTTVDGFADDYAWVICGFLDLYEASGELKWLRWALRLQHRMDEMFYDPLEGGYFSTAGEDLSILLRLKEEYDSAEPAASSVALANLTRLSAMLSSQSDLFRERAERTALSLAARLEKMPVAMPHCAFSMYLLERLLMFKKVVIRGRRDDVKTEALMDAFHVEYNPDKALLFIDPNDPESLKFWREHSGMNLCIVDQIAGWNWDGSKTSATQDEVPVMAYVCANFTCNAPTDDPPTLTAQMAGPDPVLVEYDLHFWKEAE